VRRQRVPVPHLNTDHPRSSQIAPAHPALFTILLDLQQWCAPPNIWPVTALVARINVIGCVLPPLTDDDSAAEINDVCCAPRRIFEYYAN
jgi:hypothetical protein